MSLTATYQAFFDESGIHGSAPQEAVCGYLYTTEAAFSMDEEWKAITARYGIPFFRMADCAADPGNGVFVGKSKEDRTNIARELIGLIKKYMTYGIAAVIDRDAADMVGAKTPIHTAYSLCCLECVKSVSQYLRSKDPEASVAYFFEKGAPYEADAQDLMRYISLHPKDKEWLRCDSYTFASKTDARLLQSADILAWHSTKFFKDKDNPNRPLRKDFESLLRETDTNIRYMDAAYIKQVEDHISVRRLSAPSQ